MGAETLMQRLGQWDKWPSAWDPQPGEILAGKVLEYTTGESPYGTCHVVIVDVEGRQQDGRRAAHPPRFAVWLSKQVLFNEFQKQRPQIGELIAIKYVAPPDKENAYHQYKLLVERDAGAVQLEPLGGEAGGEPKRNPVSPPSRRNAFDDDLGVSAKDLPPRQQRKPLNGVSR